LYAADVTGDGLSDIVGYDAVTGRGFVALRSKNDFTVVDKQWGAGWTLTPARLSDARRSDLVFYDPMTGAARVALSDGRGNFASQPRSWPAGLLLHAVRGAADRGDDVFGYSATTGIWFTAAFSARSYAETAGQWTTGWHVATGDLNGDGRSDVVVYDPASGISFRCFMAAPSTSSGQGLAAFEYEYRPDAGAADALIVGRPE
jgi:hypothetical protein